MNTTIFLFYSIVAAIRLEMFAVLRSATRFDMDVLIYYAWMTLMPNSNAIQWELIIISRPLWESTLSVHDTSVRGRSNRVESR